MRHPYIQNLRRLSTKEKDYLNTFYKSALLASQHSFCEARNKGSFTFEILEGSVKYDMNTGTGVFIPTDQMKKLLENCDDRGVSSMLGRKMRRFSALMLEAYRDYNDVSFQDPYHVWLDVLGFKDKESNSKSDFVEWLKNLKENQNG